MSMFCCVAEITVKEALVNSSWCGVLAGLTVLLDARYSQHYKALRSNVF